MYQQAPVTQKINNIFSIDNGYHITKYAKVYSYCRFRKGGRAPEK